MARKITPIASTNLRAIRSDDCPCCAAKASSFEWGLSSEFLSRRALRREPEPVRLFRCGACGFAWSETGLTDEQAARLYEGYRGEGYFRDRNRFEPWYTRGVNDAIGSEAQMESRRFAMAGSLARAQALAGARTLGTVLDFGGDRGQMLKGLPDANLLVHEVSGVEVDPWALPAGDLGQREASCDLVLCCQVLEHVASPLEVARQVSALARPGGWVYLEVPEERWIQSKASAPWRRKVLERVARTPKIMRGLDFVSTACRIKFGWIPPFGFWALREHLNFFSEGAIEAVAHSAGLRLILVESHESGIALVGIKT